ncbi:ADP-heptose--LPS heptosyltransferase 2 [Planctomycetes bacterium Poly30]|uniref:lipopolysaccharide heptosyltransferase II n=1 Tax=Saltatorellus ferox TaxID=2528018 RepID=A0A518ENN2_9BACT|nr:ADP-heptose--LPS heptosyltransferase 2 [Planctomycetes bacterium Poly30]
MPITESEPIARQAIPEKHRNPKKILMRLPSWVGDVVMCTPAMRAVRQAFPDAELVVEGKDYQADLVVGLDSVDRFLVDPGRGAKDIWSRSRLVKKEGFDWAILFGESERVAAAPYLARIPVRAGYGRGFLRRSLLTHDIPRPRDDEGKLLAFSMIQRYLNITRMLGIPDAGDRMETPVYDGARATVRRRLAEVGVQDEDQIVTVIAGAAFGSAKMWPPEQYAAACDQLLEQRGWKTVLAPGPGEEQIGHEVAKHSKHGIHLIIDPTLRLSELAALLVRSEIALSNDTGPRSMAVALGLPVVVPIGPTEDGHTRHHLGRQRVLIEDIECRPCRERICPLGHHECMTKITPERMVAAVDDLVADVGTGLPA